MNPKTVKRLLELPDVKEWIAFMQAEAAKLDSISKMKADGVEIDDYYAEVTGRLQAQETLRRILGPFLQGVDNLTGTDMQEYVV